MSEDKQGVIFLMGSTASGKTHLACRLYEQFSVELINVDSVQVYRGMDIGSAKLTPEEQQQFPHHLLDIRQPSEPYNASQFRDDALALINDVHERGKLPVFVGGTMLYFKALLEGIAALPDANPEVREQILKEADRLGWPALHLQLQGVDKTSAERIKPNDGQRLQRALEVYRSTGKTLTQFYQEQSTQRLDYPLLQIGLSPASRAVLHERINQRFDQMVEQGFVEEVNTLMQDSNNHIDLPAFRSAGYRQFWEYCEGLYGLDEAVEKGKAITRQLAKRQVTWLRGWKDLELFDTLSDTTEFNCMEIVSKRFF